MKIMMKFSAALFGVGCLFFLGCDETSTTSSGTSSPTGTEASNQPDVTVEYLSWSDMEKIAQDGGKVTVIDVWATY